MGQEIDNKRLGGRVFNPVLNGTKDNIYMYVDWKQLQILSKCLKQSSLCPVVVVNLDNQSVLTLFALVSAD